MKKLFIISILMVSMQVAVAQKIDTIYYDANWKGVPVKTLASFMRIAYLSGDSQFGTAKDFYITGELQTEGLIPVYIDKNDDLKSKFKGHTVSYYKSGKKQSEDFRNDSCQLEGESTYYYENGNIKAVNIFQGGKIQEATGFNEHGVKLSMNKGIFKNGKIDDGVHTEYYENGIKKSETTVKNGQSEGECTHYFENGLRRIKGTTKNGKWNGTYYQFNVDGSYCILEYSDGKPKDNYYLVHVNGTRTKMKFNTK
jgi:antitoxin component YwqK of YwqJK toxin-antitoxin module